MKILPKPKKVIPPVCPLIQVYPTRLPSADTRLPRVGELIAEFLNASTEELVKSLQQANLWQWPCSDLNAWIKVLDRFDDITDEIIQEYNTEVTTKPLLLGYQITLVRDPSPRMPPRKLRQQGNLQFI